MLPLFWIKVVVLVIATGTLVSLGAWFGRWVRRKPKPILAEATGCLHHAPHVLMVLHSTGVMLLLLGIDPLPWVGAFGDLAAGRDARKPRCWRTSANGIANTWRRSDDSGRDDPDRVVATDCTPGLLLFHQQRAAQRVYPDTFINIITGEIIKHETAIKIDRRHGEAHVLGVGPPAA